MGSLKGKLEKKKKIKKAKQIDIELFQTEVQKDEESNEIIKSTEKKKRKRERGNNVEPGKAVQGIKAKRMTKPEGESKKDKPKKKKRKNEEKYINLIGKSVLSGTEDEDGLDEQLAEKMVKGENKRNKKKKKRKNGIGKSDALQNDDEGSLDEEHENQSVYENQGDVNNFEGQSKADARTDTRNSKSKKSKKKKNEHDTSKKVENILKKREEAIEDDVYHISSVEDDCSKGMKKWLTEYHQSRPGLKVLQQRIDEFIIAHEEKLEQEKKEREARDTEDGWTVVVHHKGRKKTTDSESGITVGSVAPVIAQNQLAKKKQKEVGLNFYRFQKRETQRNEILALQSKFEEDRKRIQQLRAARKFKPY